MSNIIVTTPAELRAIVSEAVSGVLPKQASNQSQIDTITLNDALCLLKEHGYHFVVGIQRTKYRENDFPAFPENGIR